MVETPCFQSKGCGFDPWSRELRSQRLHGMANKREKLSPHVYMRARDSINKIPWSKWNMSVNPCKLWIQSVTSEQSREFQNPVYLPGIYAWGHIVPSAGLGTDLLKSTDGSMGEVGEPDTCWSGADSTLLPGSVTGHPGPHPSHLLVLICDAKVLDQDVCVAALKCDFKVPWRSSYPRLGLTSPPWVWVN